MSVLNRPMFRIPGMNNQPSGIMQIGTARANPLIGNIASDRGSSINIPPISTINTTGFRNPEDQKGPETKDLIQASQKKPMSELSNLEKLKNAALREKGKVTVDDPNPVVGLLSQKPDANITADMIAEREERGEFDDEIPVDDFDAELATSTGAAISDEGTGKAGTEPGVNILSGFTSKQNQLSDKMQTALTKVSAGIADAEAIKVGGKTLNENVDAFVAKMNEKGQEPTLADVQDDAIRLLGFDPRELEGEFEEDRKASIFLNMMKAGLAMAAGESPNAITNIARGFGVGLQGYGEDVKSLTKDLREDRREARATMYNLLKDAKSEALAKRTLELQQMEGVVNINRQLVGDKRQAALQAFNMKMTELKWNQNLLSAAADLQFKEKSLQVTKENAEKTYLLGLEKAQPEVIQFLRAKGEITLKDPSKGFVQGNITISDSAKESIDKYLKELVAGTSKGLNSGSEYNVMRKEIQRTGLIPNSFIKSPTGYKNLSDDLKRSFGIQGQALAELLEKNAGDPTTQFRDTINFIRKFKQQIPGLSMDFNSLPPSIQTYLQTKRGRKELEKLNQEGILGL
tara:strand:+ start:833 stop:2554 length:1722 start_codon:yes stop_codon:yes gene_type:complete